MKNIHKICTTLTLVAINTIFCSKALSQTELSDLSSILENPVDGKEVTLRGKIIGQQEGEPEYIFSDGTNEIVIELEDKNFSYNADTIFEVSGIVNLESQHPDELALEEDPTPEDIEIQVNEIQVISSN